MDPILRSFYCLQFILVPQIYLRLLKVKKNISYWPTKIRIKYRVMEYSQTEITTLETSTKEGKLVQPEISLTRQQKRTIPDGPLSRSLEDELSRPGRWTKGFGRNHLQTGVFDNTCYAENWFSSN